MRGSGVRKGGVREGLSEAEGVRKASEGVMRGGSEGGV